MITVKVDPEEIPRGYSSELYFRDELCSINMGFGDGLLVVNVHFVSLGLDVDGGAKMIAAIKKSDNPSKAALEYTFDYLIKTGGVVGLLNDIKAESYKTGFVQGQEKKRNEILRALGI